MVKNFNENSAGLSTHNFNNFFLIHNFKPTFFVVIYGFTALRTLLRVLHNSLCV